MHGQPRRPALLAAAIAAGAALLLAAGACRGAPAAAATKRVLIVTGEDYAGHRWQQTSPALAAALAADGRLRVEVSEDLRVLREARIEEFDALVLHFKNYDPAVPGREGFDNLVRFVARGGGLALVHFACGAFQEYAPEFEALAGRVWDPALRGHDPHGPFEVEIVDREHPITRGLADFVTTDELYTCLAGAAPIAVLAEARSKVDGTRHPIAFVLESEAGRVFHCVLGHDVAALRTPGTAALLRRGVLWACGAPVAAPN